MSGLFRKENWMSRVAGGEQGKKDEQNKFSRRLAEADRFAYYPV